MIISIDRYVIQNFYLIKFCKIILYVYNKEIFVILINRENQPLFIEFITIELAGK